MDFQCAIFDLDGTLINSTGVWNKVDEDFFNRRNVIMPPEFPQVIKTHTLMSGAVYIKDRLSLPESPEDIVKEWHDAAVYAYHNDVRIKPYVKELLELLKNSYGYKIGLATSNTHELYDQCLINNGIYDYFDDVRGLKDMNAGSKVDNARIWLNSTNYKNNEVLMIGDTAHDSEVAKALGIDCLLVARGDQHKDTLLKTGYKVFDSLKEVIAYLKKEYF